MEFMQQVPSLDTVIIPVGGGGLCAGMSAAIKQMNPECKIIAVEPEGANSLQVSLEAGTPTSIDKVSTIADSLGSPYALPYSFGLCQRFVDQHVLVSDDAIKRAMGLLFGLTKFAVEPAAAAATAALVEYLSPADTGVNIGVLLCGSNIDIERYVELVR
jgi:threonine dehydratase